MDSELAAITEAFRDGVEARIARRDAGPPRPHGPRASALARSWRLEGHQLGFVLACACAAADPLLYPHLVSIGGPDARRGLSVATHAALTAATPSEALALTAWLASAPPVLRLGLITPAVDGLALAATPFRPAARLINYLSGSDELDPQLARVGRSLIPPPRLQLDDGQRAIHARMRAELDDPEPCVMVISGAPGVGKRTAIAAVAALRDRSAIVLDGARVLSGELDAMIRALLREALFRDAIPVIADVDRLLGDPGGDAARVLARALDDGPATAAITVAARGIDLPTQRRVTRHVLELPDAAARRALWRGSLGDRPIEDEALTEIASRYRLGAGPIAAAAGAARRSATVIDRAALVEGVRETLATQFGGLAERLVVTDRWDDTVLPADTADQLHALVARVRHSYRVFDDWGFPRQTARGGGVAALFSGPPGTGKTMLAGIIARELDRDLYRVDLSQIVSKWVGETEKQLGQVFDAAESGDALLLFDEADSLFAKRTEVRSSSDRYANLEVNYLLQRVETFSGVTILTTNLDTSIDAALRRRLAAHIVFWPPEHDEQVRLWRRFLTTGAPIAGTIDHESLAHDFPDMTGANIRNAALSAAFLAAASDAPISHELLVRAARAEYRAMGRVLGGKK